MPSIETRQRTRFAVYVAAALLMAAGIPRWLSWQNEQRDLFGLEHLALSSSTVIIPATVMVTFVFGILERGVGVLVRPLQRWSKRRLPARIATSAIVVIVVLLGGIILPDLVSPGSPHGRLPRSDRSTSTNPGTAQPTTSTVCAGPASLVNWDSPVCKAATSWQVPPPRRRYERSTGPTPRPRNRCGCTRGSAPDARSRAKLAVAELERTGGFDRLVLVVATSTRTGWIDPDAAEALEMLHHGDTAIAPIQYSFLPSWISFLTDLGLASEAGSELRNGVSKA